MDQYISQQLKNENYVEIDLNEARLNKYQVHFVGYNFVVSLSSTSLSTKVRMTTDSYMHRESGLSLNDITKPALSDVPSLHGILIRSRCHVYYTVYDIKKFFRSVRISDKDYFLRIVCVPKLSFSAPSSSKPSWMRKVEF